MDLAFLRNYGKVDLSTKDTKLCLLNFMLCAALGITLLVVSSNYKTQFCAAVAPSPSGSGSCDLETQPGALYGLYQCMFAVGVTSIVLAVLSVVALGFKNRKLIEHISAMAYLGMGIPLVVLASNYCDLKFPDKSVEGQLCLTAVVLGSIYLFFAGVRFLNYMGLGKGGSKGSSRRSSRR